MGDGGLVNSFYTLIDSELFKMMCQLILTLIVVVDCLEPVTKRKRLYSRNQSQKKILGLIHRKLVSSNPEAFSTIYNHLVRSVVKCAALHGLE